jgi:hypothetical protein
VHTVRSVRAVLGVAVAVAICCGIVPLAFAGAHAHHHKPYHTKGHVRASSALWRATLSGSGSWDFTYTDTSGGASDHYSQSSTQQWHLHSSGRVFQTPVPCAVKVGSRVVIPCSTNRMGLAGLVSVGWAGSESYRYKIDDTRVDRSTGGTTSAKCQADASPRIPKPRPGSSAGIPLSLVWRYRGGAVLIHVEIEVGPAYRKAVRSGCKGLDGDYYDPGSAAPGGESIRHYWDSTRVSIPYATFERAKQIAIPVSLTNDHQPHTTAASRPAAA